MLANDLQDIAHKTRIELQNNWNNKDPEWLSLYEMFKELLAKHSIESEDTLEKMQFESSELKNIYSKIKELNRKNQVLEQKFSGDRKYARSFKAMERSGTISNNIPLYTIMTLAKEKIDHAVYNNG